MTKNNNECGRLNCRNFSFCTSPLSLVDVPGCEVLADAMALFVIQRVKKFARLVGWLDVQCIVFEGRLREHRRASCSGPEHLLIGILCAFNC